MRFLRSIFVVAAVVSVAACSTGSGPEGDEEVDSTSEALCVTRLCPAPAPVKTVRWPTETFQGAGNVLVQDDPLAGSVAPDTCQDLCHFNEAGDGCECGIANGYVAVSSVGCPAAYPYRKFVLGRWRCYQTP